MSVNETQTQGDRRGVLTGSEPASGQSERPMFRPVFAASVAAGAAVVGALSIPSDKDTFKRHVKDTFLPTTRPAEKDLELVQAQVVFRHGSRTPFEDVDPHPNDNPNVWSRALIADLSKHAKVLLTDMDSGEAADDRPAKGEPTNRLRGGAGVGVLTKAGLVQGVELGTILRERYMGDGGLVQSADDMLLRCSLTSRTVETLRGVLTGIFPKDAARTFKVLVGKKGKGSAHSDFLNFNTQCCPRLAELYFASVNEWSNGEVPEHARPLVEEVERALAGSAVMHTFHGKKHGPIAWRDSTSCRTGAGVPQLPGVDQAGFDLLEEVAGSQVQAWFSGPGDGATRTETLKLSHGRTLGEIVNRLEAAASGKSERGAKLVLYSAHDWTILPLMIMMQPSRLAPYPQFCSELAIELFRDKVAGKHYVRLKFGKGTPGPNMPRHKVETVIVEGCGGGEFCELSRFKQCVGAYIPKDFDKECGL